MFSVTSWLGGAAKQQPVTDNDTERDFDAVSIQSCASMLSLKSVDDVGWTVLRTAQELGSNRTSNPDTRSLCSVDSFCLLSPQECPSTASSPRADRRMVQGRALHTLAESIAQISGQGSMFSPSDVGRRVRVKGYPSEGVLRFVGNHHVDGLPRCGVEFDRPVGLNSGNVRGFRYFECKPKHGVLTLPQKVTIIDNVDVAGAGAASLEDDPDLLVVPSATITDEGAAPAAACACATDEAGVQEEGNGEIINAESDLSLPTSTSATPTPQA